ncbi:hypothetical protein DGWBC_0147 [Dehalogenimonas sp. WBC-2]|nr:hypothetical protein DGWBC_0147 [Dehalogenimonas sp. WBC-2]
MNISIGGVWERLISNLRWLFMSPRARYAVLWNRSRDNWE